MKKKIFKKPPVIEAMEPRLLFSDGLEGVLAQELSVETTTAVGTATLEQLLTESPETSESRAAEATRQEIIFVDTDTPDYQVLVDDLLANQDETRHFEVVLLNNDRDGITQVTEALGMFEGIDAVHIISHGDDGSIELGNSLLDFDTLKSNVDAIQAWGESFSADGDLLIYGCNLAATTEGEALVDGLAKLTGADVAASDDLTGSAQLGGDWELEYAKGDIETNVVASQDLQSSWDHLLNISIESPWTNLVVSTDRSTTISEDYTVTAAPGSDRLLMVTMVTRFGFDQTIDVTSASFGGVQLHEIVEGSSVSTRNGVWMGYLLDSEILAGNQTLTVSFTSTVSDPTGTKLLAATYVGVDQTTPINDSSANNTKANAPITFGSQIDYAAGAEVVYVASYGGNTNTNTTEPAGYSKIYTNEWSGLLMTTIGHMDDTTTAGNSPASTSVDFEGTDANHSLAVVALNPVLNAAPTFIDGSVGNWNFDEGSGDSVAESAIGISTGTLGSTAGADANDPTWTTGIFGQALHFDGVNDYIEIADAPGIDISGPEFSASLWMKPDSGPNKEDMLFMKGDRQGNINYYLSWKDTGEMTWAFKDGANWHYQDMPVTMPTTGQWNHIGITFDRPTVSLYVNGTKYVFDDVATGGSMDNDLTANDEVLWIGAGRSGGALVGVNEFSGPFTGSIDELALFDRALTDAEIEAIRTSTPPVVTASAFSIDENSANNTVVGTVVANDQDVGDTLSYAITAGNTDGAFSIDANGQIKVANSAAIDFETNPVFNLTIEATDNGTPSLSDTTTVTISLNDVNDAPTMSAWFNDAWESRKTLTINAASVAGDLTDFPVLITLNTDPELAAEALANGDDILFTTADGTTQLAHEIEFFDETTGELRVWVKTDLSGSVDTNIFMYFGNAASANQENIPGVWDNYVGVYHLSESPTGAPGELIDSSGSGNHATTEGSMDGSDSVATTIGQGLAFDGTDDMIRITDSATLDSINDEATFSLWINFVNTADGDTQLVMSSSNRYSAIDGYEWASQNDGDHFFYPDAGLPDANYNLGADPFTNSTWHHLAATMDFATKEVEIYVDGTPMVFTVEGVPGNWTTLTSSDDMLWGGNPDRATRYFLGMMDEIRIADVARSQEWIQTEVNNQSAPGTFLSVGVTEAKRDSLTDINEDDFNSAGDTVLSIINSSGADRIMDGDTGAVEGIAVVSVDDTNGTWEYSTDGGSIWTAFGAVSNSSAVLLDATAEIRFVPDADYNGSAGDLTFRAWDQTSGANGDTGTDVSTNGGATAFSSEAFAASLNVNPVNDAPANTVPAAQNTNEDTALVFSVANGNAITVNDIDDTPVKVTLTATNGTFTLASTTGLYFSAGTGSGDAAATFTGTTANINAALEGLIFLPDANYNGPASLEIQTDDMASQTFGYDTEFGSGTVTGDHDKEQIATRVSLAENGTLTGINAYLYIDAAQDIRYGLYADAAGEPGALLVESTAYSVASGTGWYTLDLPSTALSAGDYWLALDVGKEGAYFYDASGGETRHSNYDPKTGFSAPWSGTYESNTRSISVFANYTPDGATAFTDTDTVNITVAAINDAPLLDIGGTPTLTQIDEGDINTSGDSVAAIIASAGGNPITDVDATPVEGIAITWADNSNGTWQYSTDAGGIWYDIGAVSDSSAFLLSDDANNRIRFAPAENFNGAAQFNYRAWDRADGNTNATAGVDVSTNGGITAYSAATETASITIDPLQIVLYLSTSGDVSASGAPGLDSWAAGEVIGFGDPNVNFEPGTTDGTLYSILDLRNFQTGAVEPAIDGIHQVSKNITIGSGANTMDLFVGDILFAINSNSVQLTGSDLVEITTNKKDLLLFRPDTPHDYSAGTFSVVLDNFSTNEVEGISLVEVDTMVGDTLLTAGTFLYNPGNSTDIHLYTVTGAGEGTTSGVSTILIDGSDISMGNASAKVSGLDLIEADINIGNTSLTAGNILVTLDGNDAGIGNNNLAVTSNDVFYLDVTTTTLGPAHDETGTTSADAYLLVEGADLNLDTADEEITALSLDIKFGSGNEDPDISFPGSSVTYTENDPATVLDSGATVNDPDSFDFATGILRVDFTTGGTTDDRLAISTSGQIAVVGNTVTYAGVTIGTFIGGSTGSDPLVITFNSNADSTKVQAVLRNITYENVSDDPATAARNIRVVLTDGDGGTSNVENKTINMVSVNDDPALATNTGTTVAEGSTGTVITTLMLNEGDPDDTGAGSIYTVTTIPANGTLYRNAVALGINDTFTQADIDAGLITYNHDGSETLSDGFTFTLSDGGEDGASPLTGQVFSITVTPVNDAPVVTTTNLNAAENQTGAGTAVATDADIPANTLTWSLAGTGADDGLFTIDAAGVLTFNTAPDYENPGDANLDNIYEVDVQVFDGTVTTTKSITVTVTDANDAPVITTTNLNAAENQTGAGTAVATDADIPANTLTWSLAGTGADDGLFTIDAAGVLTFNTAPDYENPGDANLDNIYEVDVQVFDGTVTTTKSITVTVTDANDAPVITTTNLNAAENQTGAGTAVATDADIPANTLTWSLAGTGADDGLFTIDAAGVLTFNTAPDFENPGDAGADNIYDIDVQVFDGTVTTTKSITVTVTDVNEAPTVALANVTTTFPEDTDTTSAIKVADIVITDDALGTNNLTLAGADAALFEIVGTELRLIAGASLDFETNPSLDVTVEVDDAAIPGAPDHTASLAISVTDVNEAPTVALANVTTTFPEDTDTTSAIKVADIVITDDALGTNNLTLAGADAALFEIVGTELRLIAGASLDFETNPSLDVTVEVDDAAIPGAPDHTASLAISVTDVNEAPTVALANVTTTFPEDTDTTSAIKVADIVITDDALGTNNLTLAGADAALFEIVGTELRLIAGASLDFETNPSLDVTVEVDDAAIPGAPDHTASLAISVTDVNEAPTVALANVTTTFPEDTDTTSAIKVADIVITDDALGTNNLTLAGADAALFEIVGTELRLIAGASLDFETNPSLDVTVEVDDAAIPGAPDHTASLAISVTDVNEAPTVALANVTTTFPEDTDTTSAIKVADIVITDDALGTNNLTLAGADAALFEIVGTELRLIAGASLDFETNPSLDVTVEVDDAAIPGAPDHTASLAISVTDVNEAPTVALANVTTTFPEDTDTTSAIKVADIVITDDALGTNNLTLAGADAALFEIVGTELRLIAGASLDFETNPSLDVTVEVDDAAIPGAPDHTASLAISVTDVNEAPVITTTNLNALENQTAAGTVVVTDEDVPADTLTWTLAGTGADTGLFSIDAVTGALTFLVAPDFEAPGDADADNVYEVDVEVFDGTVTTTKSITVTVTNVNENGVSAISDADLATNTVLENAGASTPVGITAFATDSDATDTVSYSLDDDAGGRFAIDSATGIVTVNAALDYEANTSHSITVRADSTDGSFSTQSFTINVTDVDEFNINALIDNDATADAVDENSALGTPVGITAFADDLDGTDTVSYSLDDSAGDLFTIDTSTGVVTVNGALDAESATSHDITVRALSTDGSFSVKTFTIIINDVDEFDVGAVVDTDAAANTVAEDASVGTPVSITASATDNDVTDGITYSLDDSAGGRFAIDAVTGVISVNAALDYETAISHTVTVRATSDDGSFSTQAFTINVSDVDEFDISAISDTDATADAVDENVVAGTTVGITAFASDGDGSNNTISYSLTDSAGGLFSVDANTGIVTVNGVLDAETATSYDITVRADSTDGSFATRTFTITVNDLDEAPTISAIADQAIDEDTSTGALAFTVGDPESAAGALSVTASSSDQAIIPDANLVLGGSGASRTLTVTPAPDQNGGPVTITVIVSDGVNSSSENFTVTVNPVNDAAVFGGVDTGSLSEDSGVVSGDITASNTLTVSDPDSGESSFIAGTLSGTYGTLSIDAAGNWSYAADNSQAAIQGLGVTESLTDVVTITSLDGTTHDIAITITGANDVPVVNNDSYSLSSGGTLNMLAGGVLANDYDIDGDPLIATLIMGPGNGTLTLNADGTFSYAADANFIGNDSFTYQVSDGNGGVATNTVTLTVNNLPETPPEDEGTVDDSTTLITTNAPSTAPEVESELLVVSPAEINFTVNAVESLQEVTADTTKGDIKGVQDYYRDRLYEFQDDRFDRNHVGLAQHAFQKAYETVSDLHIKILEMLSEYRLEIDTRHESNMPMMQLLSKYAGGVTLSLTAGILTWALRGGALAATMLSSMPIWKGFDPLPVLAAARKKYRKDADTTMEDVDDELIDEMFEGSEKSAGEIEDTHHD